MARIVCDNRQMNWHVQTEPKVYIERLRWGLRYETGCSFQRQGDACGKERHMSCSRAYIGFMLVSGTSRQLLRPWDGVAGCEWRSDVTPSVPQAAADDCSKKYTRGDGVTADWRCRVCGTRLLVRVKGGVLFYLAVLPADSQWSWLVYSLLAGQAQRDCCNSTCCHPLPASSLHVELGIAADLLSLPFTKFILPSLRFLFPCFSPVLWYLQWSRQHFVLPTKSDDRNFKFTDMYWTLVFLFHSPNG